MSEQIYRYYKLKIKGAWQTQVPSIIETGQWLIEAKAVLKRHGGKWGKLFEGDDELPFGGQDTASKLMAVARHPVLSNSEFTLNLPASWYTLYVLSQLSPKQVEGYIRDGTIHAKTSQEEAIALVRPPTVDPRSETERVIDLLKMDLNPWLTLVPPRENDGFRAGLKPYLLERRFLPADDIEEELEDTISVLNQYLQVVRETKAELAGESTVAPCLQPEDA